MHPFLHPFTHYSVISQHLILRYCECILHVGITHRAKHMGMLRKHILFDIEMLVWAAFSHKRLGSREGILSFTIPSAIFVGKCFGPRN